MQARLCDAALVSLMSLFGFMIDLRGEWLLLRQREGSAVSVLYSLRFSFLRWVPGASFARVEGLYFEIPRVNYQDGLRVCYYVRI